MWARFRPGPSISDQICYCCGGTACEEMSWNFYQTAPIAPNFLRKWSDKKEDKSFSITLNLKAENKGHLIAPNLKPFLDPESGSSVAVENLSVYVWQSTAYNGLYV